MKTTRIETGTMSIRGRWHVVQRHYNGRDLQREVVVDPKDAPHGFDTQEAAEHAARRFADATRHVLKPRQ